MKSAIFVMLLTLLMVGTASGAQTHSSRQPPAKQMSKGAPLSIAATTPSDAHSAQIATWVTAAATGVVAAATLLLACVTWRYAGLMKQSLDQMHEQWLNSARPKLIGHWNLEDPHNHGWILAFDNPGLGPAIYLSLVFDRDVRDHSTGTNASPFSKVEAGSGESFRLVLDDSNQRTIHATIECRDIYDRVYRHSHQVTSDLTFELELQGQRI